MRALPLALIALIACKDDSPVGDDTGVPSDSGVTDDSGASVDADGDGVSADEDCDDADPTVYPGASEVCDGVDNDCDGLTDDEDDGVDVSGGGTWYADADADGYGDAASPLEACEQPEGSVEDSSDCDDANGSVYPGAEEQPADGVDADCDGAELCYADADGDGAGDEASWLTGELDCSGEGLSASGGDCDDADASAYPGAAELCDEDDEDCDGAVDEGVTTAYWLDADGDGYGDVDFPTEACALPEGYAEGSQDCDDSDAAVNPGATEICNSLDDDCDGAIDDDDGDVDTSTGETWYLDADGDGFGDPDIGGESCETPSSGVLDGSDCDDGAAAVNPSAAEVCNSVDDDCDGAIDDDDDSVDLSTGATYYADADGDGYGDASASLLACDTPSGAVSDSSDCDDADATSYPGGAELCDGADNDCDGDADDGLLGTGAACAAESCAAVLADDSAAVDGDFYLDPTGSGSSSLYACDMSTDGGGWTQVFDWDRENDGQSRGDFESTLTQSYNNMGDERDGTTYIEWSDYDATGDLLNAFHSVDIPNGGESLLDIHYYGHSMEQSGLWLWVDADGTDEDIYCEDIDYDCVTGNYAGLYNATELAFIPSYTCGAVAASNIDLNGVYQSSHSGEVHEFTLTSLHCDAGRGDYSRLYSISFWVR